MAILRDKQHVGRALKAPGRAMLAYPVYRKLIRVFLDNLKWEMKDDLLAVVLYGSVARGSATPESDIDLLILYREGKSDMNGAYVSSALKTDESPEYRRLFKEGIYGEISPMLMTLPEIRKNPLILLDMMEEGIVLYQRDNCFTDLVLRMRAKTKELGSRKVVLPDGSWYWELKPSWRPGDLIEVVL